MLTSLLLIENGKKKGRYDTEMEELDAFFKRTGYPKTPRYYIIKWLTDYVADYGIDGYRADTVKHTEASVWADSNPKRICICHLENNPTKVLDNNSFYPLPKYTTITLVPVKVLILEIRK
jgi:alpha-amylase